MTVYQAFILGVIQGVTELLPISSSAHLNIIPWMFGWNIPDSFDVALHLGTLLSIGLYFYKDWIELIKEGFKVFGDKSKILEKYTKQSKKCKMFWYIVCATIPGGIIGFLLDHFYGDSLAEMPLLIATMLIIMGIILYIVDKKAPKKTEYEEMNFIQTFLIGLSQSIAFIPGVSRSGITMTAGRLMGVSREGSAKYSFMLSTPIVLAASLYKAKDFVMDVPFTVGVTTSTVVGLLVIKFLLNYLKKGNFKVFATYRVIVGIVVILIST
ncbi:MAG: undecaprenyl-diphosphate phosphatase [Clostridia bacterium]|nr:undecaprenyl-diphosphate phosphatase [Clostridia bacterium]